MSRKKQSRAEHRAQRQRQQRNNRIIAATAGVAFLAIIVFFTWQQTGNSAAYAPEDVPDPVLGEASAPVEIIEYGDFGCSSCRAWHNAGIREQVQATFGDQVRFVWKDFPVITPQSPKAAEAAHCAGEQGQFWAYHDTVYENFSGLNENALGQYAVDVGLNLDQFNACLYESVMERKVRANEQDARQLGLRGTPSFVLNGRTLPGPPSYEQLASLIQQELE